MSSLDYQKELEHIVGTLQDGRTMARSKKSDVFRDGILTYYFSVTFKKLRAIDAILDINILECSPKANICSHCDKTISRDSEGSPVVSFTVCSIPAGITAGGTTITAEVVVVGW